MRSSGTRYVLPAVGVMVLAPAMSAGTLALVNESGRVLTLRYTGIVGTTNHPAEVRCKGTTFHKKLESSSEVSLEADKTKTYEISLDPRIGYKFKLYEPEQGKEYEGAKACDFTLTTDSRHEVNMGPQVASNSPAWHLKKTGTSRFAIKPLSAGR